MGQTANCRLAALLQEQTSVYKKDRRQEKKKEKLELSAIHCHDPAFKMDQITTGTSPRCSLKKKK